MKSWKTTVGAILGVIIFILGAIDFPVLGVGSWGESVGVILGLLGVGIPARDNDKSSEEVGVK